jgi:hypothetical protein
MMLWLRQWTLAVSQLGWSPESGGRFCVGAFGRDLTSVAVTIFFTFKLCYREFHKFCNFNAIFTDKAAINCFTVQQKDVLLA